MESELRIQITCAIMQYIYVFKCAIRYCVKFTGIRVHTTSLIVTYAYATDWNDEDRYGYVAYCIAVGSTRERLLISASHSDSQVYTHPISYFVTLWYGVTVGGFAWLNCYWNYLSNSVSFVIEVGLAARLRSWSLLLDDLAVVKDLSLRHLTDSA